MGSKKVNNKVNDWQNNRMQQRKLFGASSFWLGDTVYNNKYNSSNVFKQANLLKAVKNFVKIIAKKDIPVEFKGTESFTDGHGVTISASGYNKFDTTVGLALHEASHILYTDFQYSEDYRNDTSNWVPNGLNISNELLYNKAIEYFHFLCNWIEDRRIDALVQKSAPGYIPYYDSLYSEYFYHQDITDILKSDKYRTETWESYQFRIINSINPASDPKALDILDDVLKLIDVPNILRLTDKSVFDLAANVFKMLYAHLESKDSSLLDPHVEGTNTKLVKLLEEIHDLILNSAKLKETISTAAQKIITQITSKNSNINNINWNNHDIPVVTTVVTSDLLDYNSTMYLPFDNRPHQAHIVSTNSYIGSVYQGLNMGKQITSKLKIIDEVNTLEFRRLQQGYLDKKSLYRAGLGNTDIFKQTIINEIIPINIHISVDASGSMAGKWGKVVELLTSIAVSTKPIRNINLQISMRYCTNNIVYNYLVYDSKKQPIFFLQKALSSLKPTGATPDSLALHSLLKNKIIVPGSNILRSYFINISDGEPCATVNDVDDHSLDYEDQSAFDHTKEFRTKLESMNIGILSYYIGSDSLIDPKFESCWGKQNTSLVAEANVLQIAKTLNSLFLNQK